MNTPTPTPTAADPETAHRHFSAACFNEAWTLIGTPGRSVEDDQRMIALKQASLWHGSQRSDCSARHQAIGPWQVARMRAIPGHAAEAERAARLRLHESRGLSPFLLACAHEGLARAALSRDDRAAARASAMQARVHLQAFVDDEERDNVPADLASLGPFEGVPPG